MNLPFQTQGVKLRSIHWFRQDLRLNDNPALAPGEVLPVYILDPKPETSWQRGGASRWWLHHALASLDKSICKQSSQKPDGGAGLQFFRGSPAEVLVRCAKSSGASQVTWNEPLNGEDDDALRNQLKAVGLKVQTFQCATMRPPRDLLNGQGQPYKVFTPYWRAFLDSEDIPRPLPLARCDWQTDSASITLAELGLLPSKPWDRGFYQEWHPDKSPWKTFSEGPLAQYLKNRDRPDWQGTSRLSPYLHFGQISPRQLWWDVVDRHGAAAFAKGSGQECFLRELGWREFAYSLMAHFPETANAPLRPEFAKFPWRDDAKGFRFWQKGMTGFPIVDAGMRQLWQTGWMHNRVRMIVASFLVKDLVIDWRLGARWFWDTLVDADLPNNTLGWQWAAGCGADAAPYFRVFNPTLQGEKFDPDGAYVRRYIPELAKYSGKDIHKIQGWGDYPAPIVDHAAARKRALSAFAAIKGRSAD